jgi:uncharacterized protein YbjT (DUF2867 family)
MILVIGATGNTGREVAVQLKAKGEAVRALSRTPSKASALTAQGIEVVAGDLSDEASLAPAMAGVQKVYLATSPDLAMARRQIAAINAAKAGGVEHVVKLSVMGAAADSPVMIARSHHEADEALQASGLAWTILQPGFFMQNLLGFAGSIAANGAVYAPAGDGRSAQVDARDIAAVGVAALTAAGHAGQFHAITGPEAISFADAASAIGAAIGKPVSYVAVPPDAARQSMLGAGMPAWYVDDLIVLFDFYAKGYMAGLTDTVPRVTGRPATGIAQFAMDHAAAFSSGG